MNLENINLIEPWGIISDAHGNIIGLNTTLNALQERGVNTIFFLGDALGYLPFSSEVLMRLSEVNAFCLSGNHEAMVLQRLNIELAKDKHYNLNKISESLSKKERSLISKWPDRIDIKGPNGNITMVHGGLDNYLEDYVFENSDVKSYSNPEQAAVFMGNTHRPFKKYIGSTLIANVGSCGLPRDIGNLASCIVFDPQNNSVEILRLPFDSVKVIDDAENHFTLTSAVKNCLRRNVRIK